MNEKEFNVIFSKNLNYYMVLVVSQSLSMPNISAQIQTTYCTQKMHE